MSSRMHQTDRDDSYSGSYGKESGSFRERNNGHDRSHGSDNKSDLVVQRQEDTIYVSNLADTVNEDNMAEFFGSIGPIKIDRRTNKPKIWIYVDKATQAPKGDATVTYEDSASADAAIDWFNKKNFLGQTIHVSKAERKMRAVPNASSGRRGGYGGGGYGDRRQESSYGRGDGPRQEREGDWTCGCGAVNFARRNACFKCQVERSRSRTEQGSGERRNDSSSHDYRGGDDRSRGDSNYRDYGDDDGRRRGGRGPSSTGSSTYHNRDRPDRRNRPY